ncbi:SpoIIE family protein phosphatase [Streptomyces sp. NPDC101151]|uniref:SpoIIE family protein phosphatase n=1 Tax=Streptomyces sp. NPDC101151 TaxID=3366115 RepID=UPI00380B9884
MVRSGGDPTPTRRVTGGGGPVRSRERFLQGDAVEPGVRSPILGSWQRCRSLGLSPDQSDLPFREDVDTDSRLVRAAAPVLDRLQSRFAGSAMNISLADASGTVLLRRFGRASLARTLPAIQRVPGFVFAEQYAGTNGIGLALAERRLIRVFGAEHFAERAQGSACRAVPVRDPLSGRIEGVLCLGYPRGAEDPRLATVIRKAAEAVERRLLGQSSVRERALLRAYLGARTGAVAGLHQRIGVDVLAPELHPCDRAVLLERATELISGAQRAALDVSLSDGRRVTLVGRPTTSASGVEGMVIEAVLTGPSPPPPVAIPYQGDEVVDSAQVAAALPVVLSPGHGAVLLVPARLSAGPVPGRHAGAAPVPDGMDGDHGAAAAHGAEPGLGGAAHGAGPGLGGAGGETIMATAGGGRDRPADSRPTARGLVLVGEPYVGEYALAARRRLELLSEASARIGTTLDVRRTAEELAETAIPRLADFVTIDLPEAVLRGEESADPLGDLRRTVVRGIRDDLPFNPVGKRIDFGPTTPQLQCLTTGHAVLEPDLKVAAGWLAHDPELSEQLLATVHSLITVPLVARGVILGVASFYRSQDPAPFGDDDRSLAQELAARAALSMDNARRYTHERAMVLALQRSLLPQGLPDLDAVEVAHRYLPAESDVGGDWYDVIPLSGTRVGLFVGDVVGHGMFSAATMGRLRTAARSFAELDFPPDEVLAHLDNVVGRLDREDPEVADLGIIGATCLYAVYDPTSQQCTMARAGHPLPALVQPDGTVSFPDLPATPPLGLGGLPFETAEIHLPEDSRLVLYTDGLIEDRHRDVDDVLDHLCGALGHPEHTPEETCQIILDLVAPDHPYDDIALLVARTHAMDRARIATWDLAADPALVGEVRADALRQVADWGLDEAAFAAELILSELVTNAVRHGSGPIRVRLLHARNLICEVSDTSNTAPHMRRAASTDEGGRGLFLVAQLSRSWGARYTADGKVIWAECALDAA